MLGDKLGEENGKVTVRRVLPGSAGGVPMMETSFQAAESILGVAHRTLARIHRSCGRTAACLEAGKAPS